MATIIEFRGSERGTTSRVAGTQGRQSAEVVIFPGVRFERWGTAPAAPAGARTTTKPRRDLLEID